MLTQRRFSLAAMSAIAVLSAYSARGTQTEVIATTFAGADTSVRVLLDDAGGNITVTLTVDEGAADLRGFFLNVKDFSLFEGMTVRGDDVTKFTVANNDVIDLGHGDNLHGGGSPCPCDIGVAIGTPGIGKDDIFQTTFVLDADQNLVLDDFAGELLGVRVTSVGKGGGSGDSEGDDAEGPSHHHRDSKGDAPSFKDFKEDCKDAGKDDGNDDNDDNANGGNGSAKLIGRISNPIIPVPEPSSAFLAALGLSALGFASRKR
ncbi:MAG TPA: PEP-CTERM sorting domain-containing protein [Myxococcota bacterium]|nr:PEP-CTERM sorting domain-containing protein [Myxococcota bacterium]